MNRPHLVLVSPDIPQPAEANASLCERIVGDARLRLGALLVRMKMPGLVRDVEISDGLTGHQLRIRNGPLFTKLTIDGRDFYFNRFTGELDGTGIGCD